MAEASTATSSSHPANPSEGHKEAEVADGGGGDRPLFIAPWRRPEFSGPRDYQPLHLYVDREEEDPDAPNLQRLPHPEFQFGVPELLSLPPLNLILNSMKCSFCERIPMPDAFMCRDGHLICSSCLNSVPSCPFAVRQTGKKRTCGKRFANGRHQLITHLFNEADINCPNEGCMTRMLGKDLLIHSTSCKYSANVNCQSGGDCGRSRVPFSTYPVHLQEAHGLELTQSSRKCFLWDYKPSEGSVGCVVKELIHHCDTTFALCLQISQKKLNIWLSHFKRLDEDEKFSGHVQISGSSETSEMYFGKIHSFRDRDDVVSRSWCLAIPLQSVPTHIHELHGGKPTLVVDIFIHAGDRMTEGAGQWKPYDEHWEEKAAAVTSTLDTFKITDAIKGKLDEVRGQAEAAGRDLATEAFNEFQKRFDATWRSGPEVETGSV